MNSIDWLKSVREKGQKPHIPPDPPEGTPGENGAKPLISPDPSCSSLYFLKNRNILETGVARKNISVIEEKVETSGGSGGILRFYRGNDELRHRRDRRNQENFDDFEEDVDLEAWRDPFFTSGGDLSIPFGCDPKYHWWKPGGQSLEETRAEIRARMLGQTGPGEAKAG